MAHSDPKFFRYLFVALLSITSHKRIERIQATPGMKIQAEILGEPKTVLGYVLNPLVKTQSAALTEQ